MEYNRIDLDQYCLTQEEFDDENACKEIKLLKNMKYYGSNLVHVLQNLILSSQTALNIVNDQLWLIKIQNQYALIRKSFGIHNRERQTYYEIINKDDGSIMGPLIRNLPKDVYYNESDGSYTYANDNSYILK